MRKRSLTILATTVLAVGTALLAPAAAQASSAAYECQNVIHHSILPNTPVNGVTCTGPFPWPGGGGSVEETSTGTRYSCQSLQPYQWPNGIYVFGNICQDF